MGAAVLTEDGRIFTGANVENASYGLTICAERAAIFAAVSQGARHLQAIALVSDSRATPCGACRQVLSEFADGNFQVITADPGGKWKTFIGDELWPHMFTKDDLKSDEYHAG